MNRLGEHAHVARIDALDREDGRLDVHDLVALTADGFRALWASLATSAAVAPALRLRTSGLDPARLVLPGARWDVVERHPYMLRVGDVAGALTAARLHVPGLAAQVPFTVSGDRLGRAPATFVLHLDGDSPGTCAADDTASAADAVDLDARQPTEVGAVEPYGAALVEQHPVVVGLAGGGGRRRAWREEGGSKRAEARSPTNLETVVAFTPDRLIDYAPCHGRC